MGDRALLVELQLANMEGLNQLVEMSELVMLPSIEGLGAKVGVGKGAIDF